MLYFNTVMIFNKLGFFYTGKSFNDKNGVNVVFLRELKERAIKS